MSKTVQQVTDFIDNSNLSRLDLYKVHRHIGNMIQRRMFYQLIVYVPWFKDPICYDHTDLFEEIIEQLTKITVDCINQEVCNIRALPDEVFIFDKNKTSVLDIRSNMRDEQDFYNIFRNFLNSGYSYKIDQHEINFDYVETF